MLRSNILGKSVWIIMREKKTKGVLNQPMKTKQVSLQSTFVKQDLSLIDQKLIKSMTTKVFFIENLSTT